MKQPWKTILVLFGNTFFIIVGRILNAQFIGDYWMVIAPTNLQTAFYVLEIYILVRTFMRLPVTYHDLHQWLSFSDTAPLVYNSHLQSGDLQADEGEE